MRTKLAILSLFVVLIPNTSVAGDLTRKLHAGATLGDVLGAWGEPTEKVEKAIKREVVWYYPQGAKVVFKDGKVKSWRPIDALVQADKEREAAKLVAAPVGQEVAGETRDLVRDIAKEVPSGPDVPYVEPPAVPGGQPPLIPNQIPPGGRGAPAGVVPGGDVDLEED
ncbi:MAG: hypothetical protein RL326_88 [Pseudomonadota bacterium]|jgi:hypothetical protein